MRALVLSSLTYPRQRAGVYGDVDSPVARGPPRGDVVHRAGESLGERVCRIVQREVARRTARPRDLLHVDRSKDLDRTVASAVQHSAAAQRVGLSATGPRSHQPNAPERPDHEPSSLIRTGSTLGGRSGSSRGGRGITPEPGGVAARRLSVYAEAVAPTGPTNPLKSSLTFAPVSWPRRHAGVGVINHLFVGYCHVITVAQTLIAAGHWTVSATQASPAAHDLGSSPAHGGRSPHLRAGPLRFPFRTRGD